MLARESTVDSNSKQRTRLGVVCTMSKRRFDQLQRQQSRVTSKLAVDLVSTISSEGEGGGK